MRTKLWGKVRANAHKAVPTRAIRWTAYAAAFTAALLLALRVAGGMDDLVAYVMESGARSLPVLIAIAITYGVVTGLGWNLSNAFRTEIQRALSIDWSWGSFAILAGEMIAVLLTLTIILLAMLIKWV